MSMMISRRGKLTVALLSAGHFVTDSYSSFLLPLLQGDANLVSVSEAIRRRRAAYSAFIWKRLKAPRSFADPRLQPEARAVRTGAPE